MLSWRRSIISWKSIVSRLSVGTLLVAVAGCRRCISSDFDFNPIHLRNAKVESIATYLDLRKIRTPAQAPST